MIKMKGNIITFTGKDCKVMREAAKKAKMTPRNWVIMAIETYARNVIFHDALDYTEGKGRTRGVQLNNPPVRVRREGTD